MCIFARVVEGAAAAVPWLSGSGRCNSRKIGHCQRRVRVKVVRLYEALEKIPTHLGRLIGAMRRAGRDGEGVG
jgi:hypothetical protein